ncbi:P-loop NTPase [Candidatus Rhodoluna planktonica]|uniref:Iron-sulfur cluster carrier protein n=1 Tax=Candidatus Rhodoluna planktonica TaxID=535712 RepID=A0A1D9DZS4_9MICO|nr:P-loop NTPase [Candidatus Rhodoluna planktonica]AOY56315.1 sodium:proton antiporter [Candidatus Rhodoluna planktonica]
MSATEVFSALSTVIDPELRLPITELNMVEFSDRKVTVKLTVAGCPAANRIEADVRAALSQFDLDIQMSVMTAAEREELKTKLRNGRAARVNPFDRESLTRIFLIGSGKGGVGKSSVTANLAVALAQLGHRVGLIDADIFGFSIPGQLGLTAKPTRVDDMILPPVFENGEHAVKVISIGMFVDTNQPIAWRGPMLHRAVEQFLIDVHWGDLDFLLVDLPPGTGDVAISIGQQLPTAKSIVVTTPQSAAADVAVRSGSVGLQTGQKVFGVIENMAWLEQPNGERLELFGAGGGAAVAKSLSELTGEPVAVVAQIPLSMALREGSDLGKPVVLANPHDAAAKAILDLAKKMSSEPIGLVGKRLRVSL